MVRRQGDEARAKQRVGARGEHLDGVKPRGRGAREPELQLRASALADPVGLHRAHFVWPAVQRLERIEQIVGIVGDAEHPLLELTRLYRRARTPPLAVDHLLVGEHGLVHGIPIDLLFLAVGQTRLPEAEEHRLLMLKIVGQARGDFSIPVDRQAQRLHLLAHLIDVAQGPFVRMRAVVDGGVFGRQSEGVPPHRVEHIIPIGDAIAGDDVPHRVVSQMADMDVPGRVGEHLQDIGLRAIARLRRIKRPENAVARPGRAPFRLDLAMIVT
jgi:hypothetical protein